MLTFLHGKPTNMLWPLALKITTGFWWRGVADAQWKMSKAFSQPHLSCILSVYWSRVRRAFPLVMPLRDLLFMKCSLSIEKKIFFLCKNTVLISAILFPYLCAKLRAHRTVSGESITKASRATFVFKLNHDTGLSLLFSFHVWPSDSLVETSIECQTCGEFTLL